MDDTDDFDDEFDDDFGGIDDAALIEATQQVEHQALYRNSSNPFNSSFPSEGGGGTPTPAAAAAGHDEFRDLLEGAFDSDDSFDGGGGGGGGGGAVQQVQHQQPKQVVATPPAAAAALGSLSNQHTQYQQQQQQQQQFPRPRWAALSNGPMRQTTLTGAPLRENIRPPPTPRQGNSGSSSSSSTPRGNSSNNGAGGMTRHNYPLIEDLAQEPPTHHKLDLEAAKTWVYPTNVSLREYQFNIVQRALFNNLLVALPTGLGKTFIAAAVMLNWYRWAPDSQIAFLAPTKPLVVQQIDACYHLAGIPRSQTALLTGQVNARIRAELWQEKRVFFTTPQTIQNDLARGLADPKKIVCLVIDEAHRATGAYSYVEVVKFIRRFNSSFRVLALTATPGSKVETVQEVIDGLGISRVEIRTEESLDIRQYVHQKNIETVVIEPSADLMELRDLFVAATKPLLDELRSKGACRLADPEKLSTFTLLSAKTDWLKSPAGRNANPAMKGMILGVFSILISLAHPLTLLLYHGIQSFYNAMVPVSAELQKGSGKMKARITGNPNYQKLFTRAKEMIASPHFSEHPKLDYLVGAVLRHFVEKGEEEGYGETRVMVFSSYRGSAEEIVNTLKKHQPAIKPHIFVGQADAKDGTSGMNQKTQKEVIQKFVEGTYNTLVATSIGEEGLDIGSVDLIICYDSSKSPIRMLQRIGRAGRKREGNILVLLSKGKEEDNWTSANDNYLYIQRSIAEGNRYTFRTDQSPRILPRTIQPVVDKREIVPPVEPPSPKKVRGMKKLPKKKFNMPDGVETGFTKASRIGKASGGGGGALSSEEDDSEDDGGRGNFSGVKRRRKSDIPINSELTNLAYNYPDKSSTVGLLTESQTQHLQQNYMSIMGEDGDITVDPPAMDRFPEAQRSLTLTRHVKHGAASRRLVSVVNEMREYIWSKDKLEKLMGACREEDLRAWGEGEEEVRGVPTPRGSSPISSASPFSPQTQPQKKAHAVPKVPGNKAFKLPTIVSGTAFPKQRFVPKVVAGRNTATSINAKRVRLDSSSSPGLHSDSDNPGGSASGSDNDVDGDDGKSVASVIDITSTAEQAPPTASSKILSSPPPSDSVLKGDSDDDSDGDVDMLDVTPTTPVARRSHSHRKNTKSNSSHKHMDSDSDELVDVNELLRLPTPHRKGVGVKENGKTKLNSKSWAVKQAEGVNRNGRGKKRMIVDSDDEDEDDREDEDGDDVVLVIEDEEDDDDDHEEEDGY